MKTIRLADLTPTRRRELCRRPSAVTPVDLASVRAVCDDVKVSGDEAVRRWTQKFDGVDVPSVRVPAEELARAKQSLPDELRKAILAARDNIRTFHAAQRMQEPRAQTAPGVFCWRETRPIERVGLYIPAGKAPLPSTLLMLAVPAQLAGCPQITVCSPPQSSGTIDPIIAGTAALLGINDVFRAGGTQAVAAMAYGTNTIPKVDKVFGPGNRFVTAAKLLVSMDPDGAAIDLLAGPSEVLVVADTSANAAAVAWDLISQSEHDSDAQAVLVTDSPVLAAAVIRETEKAVLSIPRAEIAQRSLAGALVVIADSVEDAIAFSNEYAPEHLVLNLRAAEHFVPKVRKAGSVFLGAFSPVTAGDYASGTNHTLPTGGSARFSGGVSLQSFETAVSFQNLTRDGLTALAPVLRTFANAEGLEAHRRAVDVRLDGESR